jgi:hypothetical protein
MEAFARKYVLIGNAAEAYRRVYNAKRMSAPVIATEASRLLSRPDVSPLVAELRHSLNQAHVVSIESLSKELEQARELAMANEHEAAAVSATMGKAKLHGHLVDRKVIIGHLTLEQLVAGTFDEEPESDR